jgi:hypothetical protein
MLAAKRSLRSGKLAKFSLRGNCERSIPVPPKPDQAHVSSFASIVTWALSKRKMGQANQEIHVGS